jgi:transcription antitermination factor NusG
MKTGDRVRVIKGNHIGMIGIVKSIDNTVIGSFPNQTYAKTFNIMRKGGDMFSVNVNDVELIKC